MFRLRTKARPAVVRGSAGFILRGYTRPEWDYLTSTVDPRASRRQWYRGPMCPARHSSNGAGVQPAHSDGRAKRKDSQGFELVKETYEVWQGFNVRRVPGPGGRRTA